MSGERKRAGGKVLYSFFGTCNREQSAGRRKEMGLREALEMASARGSVTPGAILEERYVYYDEEAYGTLGRPWQYVPDIHSKKLDVYTLAHDQLERVVLFAGSQRWEPTSNLMIE